MIISNKTEVIFITLVLSMKCIGFLDYCRKHYKMRKDNNIRSIEGYWGYYIISDHGEVTSLERRVRYKGGGTRCVKHRVLKPKKNKGGYLSVVLCKNGKKQQCYIHRLVAEAFLPNPFNLPFVNHKNGIPGDNRVENLEWVSHAQNVKHAYESGFSTNVGGSHCQAVGVIDNELGMEFNTIKEWAEARGLKYSTGRNFLNGQRDGKGISRALIIKLNGSEDEEKKA